MSVAGWLLFIKVIVKRCDRILWKTTIIPVPQNKEIVQDSTARLQTRVSQFMDAFRSPSQNLPDSTSAPKRFARSNTVSPPPTAPLPSRRPTTIDSSFPKERPHSASISKWRFLPGFLSPTSPQNNKALEHPGPAVQSTHTKGDIVCLDYNTLDDREMRRLEGRSDHRPVIGAYVISL